MSSSSATATITQVSIPSTNKLGDCPGYLSTPTTNTPTTNTMGIIILQEWWGVNDHIKSKGIKIASDLQSLTLIPDLYRGQVAIDREHANHLMTGLDWPNAIIDILSAAKYLKEQCGCTTVGITGFCMGGALTLLATASQSNTDSSSSELLINAASCFYGIPPQFDTISTNIKVPVIAHFGELDEMKGFSDVESANKLQQAWNENGVNGKVYIYPNCHHAFTNNSRPEVYNEEACQLSFDRMYQFFKTNLLKQ